MNCGTRRRPWTPIIDGDVARIPLAGGQLFAIVDVTDLQIVAPYAWAPLKGVGTHYAVTQRGRVSIQMHRLITEAPKGMLVDHEDRIGLNCRRENMTICTRAENCRRRISTTGKQPFKGAAIHRASGLFHSTICVDGRQISLGYFKAPEDAARAYDAAAKIHFGAFALTNEDLGKYDR